MGKGQKLRRQAAEAPLAAGIASTNGIPIPIVPTPFRGTAAMPTKPPQPPSAKDAKSSLKSATPPVTVSDEPTDEIVSFFNCESKDRLLAINNMLQTACSTALRASHSMENLSLSSGSSNNVSPIKHASSANALDEMNGDTATLDLSCTGANLFAIIERYGLLSPESEAILASLPRLLNTSSATATAVYVIDKLLTSYERSVEAVLLPLLFSLWSLSADRVPYVRDTASSIANALARSAAPYTFSDLLPALMEAWDHSDWRVRVAALSFLTDISPRASQEVSKQLPDIIPKLAVLAADSKKQVQAAALDALSSACATITNTDMTPLVPRIVSVIARPEESAATLDCLLETTFVNTVDASSLALMQPLLMRALRHNSTSPLKRKAARVIDNMCRLAQTPADIAPFESMLPPLRKVVDEVCDEEVCQVAREAVAVVETALKTEHVISQLWNTATIARDLNTALPSLPVSPLTTVLVQHLVKMTVGLILEKNTENSSSDWRSGLQLVTTKHWNVFLLPYASVLCTAASDFIAEYRRNALGDLGELDMVTDDGEEELCNIEFSLAFGGKMLLHNTQLRLCRGHKYGVMAKNGGGKTTLLKNIANGNIEGLPPTLTTVYVQHNEAGDNSCSDGVLDELMMDSGMVTACVTREAAQTALKQAQFTDTMLSQPRSALSGGWKMKLLVVKAMLAKADVLLLDEPTNHLDSASVEWLVNYLNSQRSVTCLIVSHDPAFLDRVVTDIIHYENMTLVYYPGTLQHFVTLHPEAKFYYELETSTMQFTFPIPGRLDGINSTTKSILKITNATYTYPGASMPSIIDATVKVCLGSRVAVLGQNGAGKSTLIKLLVQETQPDIIDEEKNIGVVWKHHNLRVAYVAQHSFHHVEKHLDVSPVDYIKWRFEDGVDREDMNKETVALTTEEERRELKYGDVRQIVGRRKNGRTMEYECVLVGQTIHEDNTYIPMEELVERGFGKLVLQCDARVAAAAAGVNLRPLLIKEIQSHLDDFNLEAEYGTHSKIRLLSGGQKVKLVLAAAMWNKPHVLVLDEPTNYLDREALAALTTAIKAFAGGVVIISHNAEFTDAICTEKWIVRDRHVYVEGEAEQTELKSSSRRRVKAAASMSEEPVQDKTGNTNKTKAVVELLNNPKTLEKLTSVQVRKLTKLAAAAGLPLKEYVAKINKNSPEWKWL